MFKNQQFGPKWKKKNHCMFIFMAFPTKAYGENQT